MQIDIPRQFNAASHFLDRPLREGRADKIAIECGEERITYRQLLERVNQTGNALRRLGVRQEDRVGLLLLDTPDFACCFFGAIKTGAVPIPLNTLLKPEEYLYMLNDSRARVLIVADSLYPQIQAIGKEKLRYLETIIIAGQPLDGLRCLQHLRNESSPELQAEATCKDDSAFWLYSSGSTGFPKGCVHLQHDMAFCTEYYAKPILNISEQDITFSAAKLCFAYGLGNNLYFPFAVGASAVHYPGRPLPEDMFKVVEQYRPTIFYGVPTLYASMLVLT